MDEKVKNVIEDCARAAYAGTRQFGEIVGALIGAGVEGYHVDYRAKRTTYYLPGGDAHTLALSAPSLAVPPRLDSAALQEAIRGSQRGEVKYREFLPLSMRAGCVGYEVFFQGRQVVYVGRDGSQHIERFPD